MQREEGLAGEKGWWSGGEVEERVAEERRGGAGGRKVKGAERFEERRWGGKEGVCRSGSRERRGEGRHGKRGKARKEGEKSVRARHGRCAQV